MRRKFKKYIIKPLFIFSAAFSVLIFSTVIYVGNSFPDNYTVNEGSTLNLETKLPVSIKYDDTTVLKAKDSSSLKKFNAKINLLGFVPAKNVNVAVVSKNQVVLGGEAFGIKLYTNGVLVVDVDVVDTEKGNRSPAADAGIKPGDYILTVAGKKVQTNEDVAKIVEQSGGKELAVLIMRDNRQLTVMLKPEISYLTGKYKAGVWVKDSGAGIGTLTFHSPVLGITCGLGHGISDSETGKILTINSGELVPAEIFGIEMGKSGSPGELKGKFKDGTLGKLITNTETGVYASKDVELNGEKLVEIAYKQEIKTGSAEIITTVDGESGPETFKCEIEKISYSGSITKNMLIKITDPALIDKTGGIVQGMSGSPIIQNGKLIGAVTHVLVDDPTKGYAIFAENMLETAQSVSEQQLKEAS